MRSAEDRDVYREAQAVCHDLLRDCQSNAHKLDALIKFARDFMRAAYIAKITVEEKAMTSSEDEDLVRNPIPQNKGRKPKYASMRNVSAVIHM